VKKIGNDFEEITLYKFKTKIKDEKKNKIDNK